MGITSRRQAETWITDGRIEVNGYLVTELGFKVDPETDQLKIDGKPVVREKPPHVYWLFHKPDETLTSTKSEDDKPTIFDLPSLKKLSFKVFTVGRLDYRTEGLLILSNDGELVSRLTHPKYKLPRLYQVLTTGKLKPEQEQAIREGIELDGVKTKRCQLQYVQGKNLGKSRGSWYYITVYEGRNRLVRRLFEHCGNKVVRLIRIGYGDLKLPADLKPGHYRQLSSEEIKNLKEATGPWPKEEEDR